MIRSFVDQPAGSGVAVCNSVLLPYQLLSVADAVEVAASSDGRMSLTDRDAFLA